MSSEEFLFKLTKRNLLFLFLNLFSVLWRIFHRHTWWIWEILGSSVRTLAQFPSLNSDLLHRGLVCLQLYPESLHLYLTVRISEFDLPPEVNSCLDTSPILVSPRISAIPPCFHRTKSCMLTVWLSTYNFVTLSVNFGVGTVNVLCCRDLWCVEEQWART